MTPDALVALYPLLGLIAVVVLIVVTRQDGSRP